MRMLNLLITTFLFMTIGVLEAKTLVISDVDDTIKMTGSQNKKLFVNFNALFRRKAFSGMSDLYHEVVVGDTVIFYVSGAPKIVRYNLGKLLEKNAFPQRENVILKEKSSLETFSYKVNAIRGVIKEVNPDKIMLIGDDTEKDPEVYDFIAKENPELVESIYIRKVMDRRLPENVLTKTFVSAVEIAGHELLGERLTADSFSKVAEGFLAQNKDSGIALRNYYCPKKGSTGIEDLKKRTSDASTIKLLNLAQAKIIKRCNE